MRDLTKAQITVGTLACFAIVWGLIQQAYESSDDLVIGLGIVVLQLVAIFVISIIILGILEWIKLFDLKTNSIMTLIVLISVQLFIYLL